jgi:hypothetical protein
MRRPAIVVIAALLVLAACGGGGKAAKDRAKVGAITTTSLAPSTTAPPSAAVSPLTGLPVADAGKASRVALIVKIDNAPEARPQAGLVEADVVYEEMVEGGITRLAAVYQSTDATPVGPVRSARTTDVNIASELNHPLYGYSGGNKIFLAAIARAPLTDVGVDHFVNLYRRDGKRTAPHNLFSDTVLLYSKAPAGSSAPTPLFTFRPKGSPAAGAGAAPVAHVTIAFPSGLAKVTWDWDAAAGVFRRGQNNTADVDIAGRQASAENVLIRFTSYHNVGGIKDPSGAPVPEAELLGQGEAWMLSGGMIIKGTWSKPTPTAITTFVDSGGQPFKLSPGHTWIELAPPGTATPS